MTFRDIGLSAVANLYAAGTGNATSATKILFFLQLPCTLQPCESLRWQRSNLFAVYDEARALRHFVVEFHGR